MPDFNNKNFKGKKLQTKAPRAWHRYLYYAKYMGINHFFKSIQQHTPFTYLNVVICQEATSGLLPYNFKQINVFPKQFS